MEGEGSKSPEFYSAESEIGSNCENVNHVTISDEPKLFECVCCGKKLKSRPGFAYHMKTHDGEKDEKPFECQKCHKMFSDKSNLKRHMQTHSAAGKSKFQCNICKKTFALKHHLSRHMDNTHSGPTPYKCRYCQENFESEKVLTKHLVVHMGDSRFECTLCDKSFAHRHHLTRHMKKHSGERQGFPEKATKVADTQDDSSDVVPPPSPVKTKLSAKKSKNLRQK